MTRITFSNLLLVLAASEASGFVIKAPQHIPADLSSPYNRIGILESKATANDYVSAAVAGINAMQSTWYDESNGIYENLWWNSANAITVLADLQEYFPDDIESLTSTVFPNTHTNGPTYGDYTGFLDGFYDDEMWWALAWIKVYEVTQNSTYLDTASSIFEDAKSVWGSATCGGLWWDKAHTENGAIANELYLTTAARLARLKPNDPSTGYYLNEAVRAYDWFLASGMINSQNLINNGLNLTTCKNDNGGVFTYTQGALLTGLAELTMATGNNTYATLANTLALAAIGALTNDNGILVELCEPDACDGDEDQFKGVFARNIQFLYQNSTVLPSDTAAQYKSFLTKNADSILANDNNASSFGLVWSGPYATANVATQGSALDAIIGAACVS